MIPPVPTPPPVPGIEAGAIADTPPLILPEVDPEADVLLPSPVPPPLPEDFEIVPGPALVTPPEPVEPDIPPPTLEMMGGLPAPAEGPDVTIAQGYDRLRELAAARTAAEREGVSAADELRQAAAAYQTAKTPEEQAKALQAAEQAKQRGQGAQAVAQATGLAQEREQAAQAAEVDSAVNAERGARMAEAAEVLDARAVETQKRVADAQLERQRAQERRAEREQQYAAMLDAGPQDKAATWTAAIGMIGEMWSAFAQRRQPNMTVWLDRGLAQAKAQHAGELDALRVQIGAEEQAIEDVAVDVAQRQADDLAFEQSYLAKLDRDLAVLAQQYGQTPQGMAAEEARRGVQAQQQMRAAAEQSAFDKAERENANAAAEIRLKAAQASKAEAEAAKLARRGTSAAAGAKYGARTDIAEAALVDPITGVVLGESRFQDGGKVREDQETVNNFTDAMSKVEDYIQSLSNVGRVYKQLGSSAFVDNERARLEALYSDLFMKTQKALTGAAVTESEEKRIKKIIPEPKSIFDAGDWEPADVMRQYRDSMSREYKNFLTSRLKTGGTLIRGPQGETLPTSPTYSFDVAQGQAPVESKAGRILTDLAKKHDANPIAPNRETLLLQERRKYPDLGEVEIARRVQRREDEADPFKGRVDTYWRDALDSDGDEQAEVVNALRQSRDALDAVGDAARVEYLDTAIKQIEQGVTPRQYRTKGPLRKDPRAADPFRALGGD